MASLNQRSAHVHAEPFSVSVFHSCPWLQMKRRPHALFFFFFLPVGGASALSIYTILLLKLYSYKDVNLWCRELSTIKVKKLSRSLSCECTCTLSLKNTPTPPNPCPKGQFGWLLTPTLNHAVMELVLANPLVIRFVADATSNEHPQRPVAALQRE